MLNDWLFITEKERVYCALKIGCLSAIDFISSLKGLSRVKTTKHSTLRFEEDSCYKLNSCWADEWDICPQKPLQSADLFP
jgi:hypothetical protein